MVAKTKRITDVTKDFDLKSTKEAIALFKELGIEKNTGSTLDDTEYEIFLQVLTHQNQIGNLDDYLDHKATLVSDYEAPSIRTEESVKKSKMKEKAAPKKESVNEKEVSRKVEPPRMNDILSRVSVSSTYKKTIPASPNPATGTETNRPVQDARSNAKQQTPFTSTSRSPIQQQGQGRNDGRRDRLDRGARPQQGGTRLQSGNATGRKSPINQADLAKKMEAFRISQEQRIAADEEIRRANANMPALAKKEAAAKQQAENVAVKTLQNEPSVKAAPQTAPIKKPNVEKVIKTQVKKEPVDRFSRFEKLNLTAKPTSKKDDKQPKQDKRPNKMILEAGTAMSGAASETVIAQAPKTRVVDTRTTVVDLSRYDEKLDRFAAPASDLTPQRQKLRKQDTRSQGKSAKDKNRFATEKIKKLEMEMARKKQLEITVPEEITVGELATRLKKTSAEVIRKLIKLGVMATVNQVIDYDTAFLVSEEFGAKVTKEVVVTIEERLFDTAEDNDENLQERSPVVCVMGHVDHGKTSLLDAIRHTNVTSGEAGGITQAIGAYRVKINGKDITFLDTPGHEAFTAMRARGAQATDIAILVVAGDDGIMPQTIEAIHHAKEAGVEIIVAINKMDKPQANADQVMQELTKYDLLPEAWGGETICVPVSALTGMGIDTLLESVLLVAEVKELKANPNRRAKGLVIESRLDRGRGPVATVLVQNGTLHQSDIVIAGTSVGRVRAMTDDNGLLVKDAGPSVPVEIVGLSEVPQAGDEFNAVEDEKMARSLAEQRREKAKQDALKSSSKVSLDDLFARISEGAKTLKVIVKADVDGSAEAVKASLEKIAQDDVRVDVIHTAVGGINENDVMLASASNAIIVGFNVRPDKNAIDIAERQGVDIRTYRIIYECIQEITASMKGLLAPTFKEVLLGHAQVRQTIGVPGVGTIAGSYVQDGKITRRSLIRVIRDGVVVFEDKISSLRRFKDDVKEVAQGYECGIGLERFNDIKENDILEAYEMQEIER